jgi:Ca-activated chloride channel family protein
MNRTFLLLTCVFLGIVPRLTLGNGVLVVDAGKGKYVRLLSSTVSVKIDNQVSIVTTIQYFKNVDVSSLVVKYAFPMPDGANAIKLRWKRGEDWYTAAFSAGKQDTTLPGGSGTMAAGLKTYLGGRPLYFGFDFNLKPDSLIVVELTYVQLLAYKNGLVFFTYPSDYHLIQTTPLDSLRLSVTLSSQRTIETVQCVSHPQAIIQNTGHSASVELKQLTTLSSIDYLIKYGLSLTELGLFGFSTKLPDSLGYFAFIVEPNPTDTKVIPKNFAIIIDRSGSMGGSKMDQAKNAATYIINNLNNGDRFDVIDFDDQITKFRPQLVDYGATARDSALKYISNLGARSGTDIANAFLSTIPLFSNVSDTSASLIIFLTDGQATVGVLGTDAILSLVSQSVAQTKKQIFIFTFGIGSDVNTQLLTLLATRNNGLAEFLGNDVVESRITDFYNTIRYPLLINPTVTFSSALITEPYPIPLPNLYKGRQLLVSGLYVPTAPVEVMFTGNSFGRPVTYKYNMSLSDTAVGQYSFLPKVWAKQKIEFLLTRYYTYDPNSGVAKELREAIIQFSLDYGVMSPFTSFTSTGGATQVAEGRTVVTELLPTEYQLLGNYPNPFNAGTVIKFRSSSDKSQIVIVKIYGITGQLIRRISITTKGKGEYQIYWDGRNDQGAVVPSGAYFYIMDYGKGFLAERMSFVK